MPPIRGTPLEIGGGVAVYLLVGYFLGGGGGGASKNMQEFSPTISNSLPQN